MNKFLAIVPFLTFLFFLPGCGGGGNSGSSNGSTTTQMKPTASPVSLQATPTIPYLQQKLVGNDPNGNTLTFELISPATGTGYSGAYLDPTGMFYVTVDTSQNGTVTLQYHVTNGSVFSDPATISIDVKSSSSAASVLGAQDVAQAAYASYPTDYSAGNLYATPSSSAAPPARVDLSGNFPVPGDQGTQGSCVGWATAYALKSYQERLETGWALNQWNHLFSPAFIYNQINNGRDNGSLITDALNLIVREGAATLATMPYSDTNYLTQPTASAFNEAANFRAASWAKVSSLLGIKAQLANKRPVVVSMKVYNSFRSLKGSHSVYNTASGGLEGGHAVTIIGYDDAVSGGAFKVINSWGVEAFGDGGYFWIPYSFAPSVINEAYVLLDLRNTGQPAPDVRPAPTGNLPDLTVRFWEAKFNQAPGGAGTLTYEVKNQGTATAKEGFDVCLMLSTTPSVKDTGTYVGCEQVPFGLAPGASALRSSAAPLSFNFPSNLAPGSYYMSLWVDDLNTMAESNKANNWSFGTNKVQIVNPLADLTIDSWYLGLDNGTGQLTLKVTNIGAADVPANLAQIRLVLSPDQNITSSAIVLMNNVIDYPIRPGVPVSPLSPIIIKDMNKDINGRPIPAGYYFVALWVDPTGAVPESNKYNNVSVSWNTLPYTSAAKAPRQGGSALTAVAAAKQGFFAYNGKTLPRTMPVMTPVALRVLPDGTVTVAGQTPKWRPVTGDQGAVNLQKRMEAADTEISPTTGSTTMPAMPLPVAKRPAFRR